MLKREKKNPTAWLGDLLIGTRQWVRGSFSIRTALYTASPSVLCEHAGVLRNVASALRNGIEDKGCNRYNVYTEHLLKDKLQST